MGGARGARGLSRREPACENRRTGAGEDIAVPALSLSANFRSRQALEAPSGAIAAEPFKYAQFRGFRKGRPPNFTKNRKRLNNLRLCAFAPNRGA